MKIDTKYNLGQTVYFIYDWRLYKGVVDFIEAVACGSTLETQYSFDGKYATAQEKDCFPSEAQARTELGRRWHKENEDAGWTICQAYLREKFVLKNWEQKL